MQYQYATVVLSESATQTPLMDSMTMFGKLIRRARVRSGLDQQKLGERLGRDSSFVSRIETGRSTNPPDPMIFSELSRILHLDKTVMLQAMGYLSPEETDPQEFSADSPGAPRLHLRAVVDMYEWEWTEALQMGDMIQAYMKRPEMPSGVTEIPMYFSVAEEEEK